MENIFKKIATSYWLIVLLMLNDIITMVRSLFNHFDWSVLAQINWFDSLLKLVIGIFLIKLFRAYLKLKDDMACWTVMTSLANFAKLDNVFKSKWSSYSNEHRISELNKMIDEEKNFIRVNLQSMFKEKSVENIDDLIVQFYPFKME